MHIKVAWDGKPLLLMATERIERQYGEVSVLEKDDNPIYSIFSFEVVPERLPSAQKLEVFLRMPQERLRLGCGLECADPMHPLQPKHSGAKTLPVCHSD